MEFGRVEEKELSSIDFSLPAEPGFNKKIVSGKPAKQPKVYLGCAKWGRPEWVGKIYPYRTKEKDFLKHYVDHYNAIELNAMHHKLYGPLATAKWAEKGFGFWFDTTNVELPPDFNALQALRIVGYNINKPEIAIQSYKIHFVPQDTTRVISDADKKILFDLEKKYQ